MKDKSNLSLADVMGSDINRYTDPLEERYYNSPKYIDFLDNKHFHHTEKGCRVEMIEVVASSGDRAINKICKTHNKRCSKTGWEIGWYMGTRSDDKSRICRNCKQEFKSVSNEVYCDDCKYDCRRFIIFINNNYNKACIFNSLDKISMEFLLELKKRDKFKNIINYQIKHKLNKIRFYK